MRSAWVSAVPGLFMIPVTMSAGDLDLVNKVLPDEDWLKVSLSTALRVIMAVFVEACYPWWELSCVKSRVKDPPGQLVLAVVPE